MRLPRRLMGARPSTLDISEVALVEWLQAADGIRADSQTSPLARVRALTLSFRSLPPDAMFVAQTLRAAPQLRRLTFDGVLIFRGRWGSLKDFFTEPAFAGLNHPRLRHIVVTGGCLRGSNVPVPPEEWGVQLRQRPFPCLRRLTVKDEEYAVCAPEEPQVAVQPDWPWGRRQRRSIPRRAVRHGIARLRK
jgi:hypothetical protein